MNNLPIYLFVSITLIALTLLVLHIYRKQIPFLKEDKIEVNFDAENALEKANKTVLDCIEKVDSRNKEIEEVGRLKENYERTHKKI